MRPTTIYISALLAFILAPVMLDTFARGMQMENKVVIELPWLPSRINPGDKPITISNRFLSEILPELKNPRFISLSDIGDDYWIQQFLEGGFTFVLMGDFNRDGIADVAFTGKFDNDTNPELNSFFAIVSIANKKVVRDFMVVLPVQCNSVWLKVLPKYKKVRNAIRLLRDGESEDILLVFWDGAKYVAPWANARFVNPEVGLTKPKKSPGNGE